MDKKLVDYTECAAETLKALSRGRVLLVAAGGDGKPNAMAIGWAAVGPVWNKPVFITLVRPSRYTYQLIQESGEFTVNVAPESLKEAVTYCGSVSGKDHDKLKEKGLTAVPSRNVAAPVIKECIINFECRVIHRNDVVPAEFAREIVSECYPTRDFHRLFFGEILACHKAV